MWSPLPSLTLFNFFMLRWGCGCDHLCWLWLSLTHLAMIPLEFTSPFEWLAAPKPVVFMCTESCLQETSFLLQLYAYLWVKGFYSIRFPMFLHVWILCQKSAFVCCLIFVFFLFFFLFFFSWIMCWQGWLMVQQIFMRFSPVRTAILVQIKWNVANEQRWRM